MGEGENSGPLSLLQPENGVFQASTTSDFPILPYKSHLYS